MTAPPEVTNPGDDAEDVNALMEDYAAGIHIEVSADSQQPQPKGRCPTAFVASLPQPLRHDKIVAQNAQKARAAAGTGPSRVLGAMLTSSAKAAAAGQLPAATATTDAAAAVASAAKGPGAPAGKTARPTAPGKGKEDQRSSSSSSL